MEGHVRKPLEKVIAQLANFRDVETEALADIIAASQTARLAIS